MYIDCLDALHNNPLLLERYRNRPVFRQIYCKHCGRVINHKVGEGPKYIDPVARHKEMMRLIGK